VPWDVYRPAEDTYLLLDHLTVQPGQTLLEVGCGCGVVALKAARMGAQVVALDVNPSAGHATKLNADLNGCAERVDVVVGDLLTPLRAGAAFDVIVFNPPYLPHEPGEAADRLETAWCGGPTGAELTQLFLDAVRSHVHAGSELMLVQSSLSGGREVCETLAAHGFKTEQIVSLKLPFEEIFCLKARFKGSSP